MIELHHAAPDDAWIDELDLGDGEFAEEPTAFFRSRRWFQVHEKKEKDKRKPPTFVVVADVDGRPTKIGMVAMTRRKVARAGGDVVPVLSIEVMGIHRPFQGRGVDAGRGPTLASLLMAHLREHAVGMDLPGIALLVRAENAKAIAYYRKCGFEVVEEVAVPGHPTTLRMALWFSAP